MIDAFERLYGFPRRQATLANWRTRPWSTWSFHNVGEFVPSATISDAVAEEEWVARPDLEATRLSGRLDGRTVADALHRSSADAVAVMKDGRFVWDWCAETMRPGAPHLVFSISKSLTAILAGIVEDEGRLDPSARVGHYVPELAASAYGDCSLRDVLDMRVSVDFEEVYLDPESAFARYRRAMLWNPGAADETLLAFLSSLPRGQGPHGGPFRYLSPNSDALGVVVERAAGERYADLLRDRLWRPVCGQGQCLVTVDGEGTARAAGGVSITARDLARIGEMMRNGGMAGSRPLLSERWVRDTTASGGDAEAWQAGDMVDFLPNGRYRNQWYQTGDGAFFANGIHGQWLYVDPERGVVIVQQSCQAEPDDLALKLESLDLFRQIARIA